VVIASVGFYYLNLAVLSGYGVESDIYGSVELMFSCTVFYLLLLVHVFSTTVLELFWNRFTTIIRDNSVLESNQ